VSYTLKRSKAWCRGCLVTVVAVYCFFERQAKWWFQTLRFKSFPFHQYSA